MHAIDLIDYTLDFTRALALPCSIVVAALLLRRKSA